MAATGATLASTAHIWAPLLAGGVSSLARGKGSGGGKGGKGGGTDKAAGTRARQAYSTGRPEKTRRLIKNFQQYFTKMLAPGLQKVTDAAAMGSETLGQGFRADVARRGLSGSGADLFGQQGIRAARQATVSNAQTDFFTQALQGAMGQANQTQGMQIGALTGVPIGQKGPNPYGGLADMGENFLANWLANQGQKGGGVPGLQNPASGMNKWGQPNY